MTQELENNNQTNSLLEEDNENLALERDIIQGRKFTLADVIAREGGNFLKGESPIPKLEQVKNEVNHFIGQNLHDFPGALQAILQANVKSEDAILSKNFDSPLKGLAEILTNLIDNEYLFYEFVKQVDRKWGEMHGERPHFQKPGEEPHPDDEYTHESVKTQLVKLRAAI